MSAKKTKPETTPEAPPRAFFSLEHTDRPGVIRMTVVAANRYVLDVSEPPYGPKTGEYLIGELCRIAPALLRLDADLAEYYDDAGRTKPRYADLHAVKAFRMKYAGRIEEIEGSLEGMEML